MLKSSKAHSTQSSPNTSCTQEGKLWRHLQVLPLQSFTCKVSCETSPRAHTKRALRIQATFASLHTRSRLPASCRMRHLQEDLRQQTPTSLATQSPNRCNLSQWFENPMRNMSTEVIVRSRQPHCEREERMPGKEQAMTAMRF